MSAVMVKRTETVAATELDLNFLLQLTATPVFVLCYSFLLLPLDYPC